MIIHDDALPALMKTLQAGGYKGTETDFRAACCACEAARQKQVQAQNVFKPFDDRFQCCQRFVFRQSTMTEAFCKLFVSKDVVVIREEETSYGGSVGNFFDEFHAALCQALPEQDWYTPTFIQIDTKGHVWEVPINEDMSHWYFTNLKSPLDFDLDSLS